LRGGWQGKKTVVDKKDATWGQEQLRHRNKRFFRTTNSTGKAENVGILVTHQNPWEGGPIQGKWPMQKKRTGNFKKMGGGCSRAYQGRCGGEPPFWGASYLLQTLESNETKNPAKHGINGKLILPLLKELGVGPETPPVYSPVPKGYHISTDAWGPGKKKNQRSLS